MTELRKRMIESLQLRGLSERTQEAYVRGVRQLADHYHKSPDLISQEELRQYFLHIKNVKKYSRASSTIATSRKKLRNSVAVFTQWCKQNRNVRLNVLFPQLNRKLRGITTTIEGMIRFLQTAFPEFQVRGEGRSHDGTTMGTHRRR